MAHKLPEYITENPDGSLSVKLDRGVEINGAKVTTLTMREPTVEDQLTADDMKGSDGRREVYLIANLAEITPDDVGRLKLKDYSRAQEAYAAFL